MLMELLVIGGDVRFVHLTNMAIARGIRAASVGLRSNCDQSIEAIRRAGALLMPNPWRGRYRLPHEGCPYSMEEIIKALPKDALVLLFGTDDMPEAFRAQHGDRIIDLLRYEPFILRNAILTAEGGIYSAMSASDVALIESKALVIGYGRIGRALTRMLLGLGVRGTVVCARRVEVRRQIEYDGARAIRMEEMPELLGEMQFIFVTPPQTVLEIDDLKRINRQARLIDLGSPPYGFDLDRAIQLGLNAVREPGLPGRYCPMSAAEALLEAVHDMMRTARKE